VRVGSGTSVVTITWSAPVEAASSPEPAVAAGLVEVQARVREAARKRMGSGKT
jgi:hypothetical protein